jgi:methyltransferase (TIGR00027 family)
MKPTSKTAIFCCGARMLDAESCRSVCKDNYAKLFMDKETFEVFDKFKEFKNAIISNATRHRIIDDLVNLELNKNPANTFILIGSGFDTRGFRLEGGQWVELDDPQLISYKNKCLPISKCKNSLKRIPYDYEKDSLSEKLLKFKTSKEVIIIIEGVFIYIDDEAKIILLKTLQQMFPNHVLICDLQSLSFFRKFNTKFQKVLEGLGTPLRISSDMPEQIFLNNGYKIKERIPILDKTMEYAKLSVTQLIVKLLLKTVFKKIKDGYSIYLFKYDI